jgi:hypothetical protein
MITRRRFLIGAAGIATIPFNFYETAYAFFQNHSEPLLIAPKEVRETLYLCCGSDNEFLLGAIDPPVPRLTWRYCLEKMGTNWESEYESELAFEAEFGARLDDFADEESARQAWLVDDAPNARAYHYLDSLGIGESKQVSRNLEDLIFQHPEPFGQGYCSVTTYELFTASLVQHELNRRGAGIKVEIYNP